MPPSAGCHPHGTARRARLWSIGSYFAVRKVAARKSYSVRFYNAAWGPSTQLPTTINGRVSFGLNDMFTDPYFRRNDTGGEGGDKATATLVYKGKTVKTRKDRGWEPEMTTLDYTDVTIYRAYGIA